MRGAWIFFVLYSTLVHLLPLRFYGVGGCRDRTQDCFDSGIGSFSSTSDICFLLTEPRPILARVKLTQVRHKLCLFLQA
jgi:hypothetical protein